MSVAQGKRPSPLTPEQRAEVEERYHQYHRLVRRIVTKFARRSPEMDRRDLDLVGFETLVNCARLYDPTRINAQSGRPYSFGAYLGRSVSNALVNYLRKWRQEGTYPLITTDGYAEVLGSDEPADLAIECPLRREWESEEIWKTAERVLTHREYWLLRRIYVDGLSVAKAGRRLGVLRMMAWTIQQSALAKLREALPEFEHG